MATKAHVNDVGAVVRRVDDALANPTYAARPTRRENLDGKDFRRPYPHDPHAVISDGCHGAGDVSPMAMVIVGIIVVVDEVPAVGHSAGEIRMAIVHAGVDDSDEDTCVATLDVPRRGSSDFQ